MAKITVENTEITVIHQNEDDFISLTDMAKSQLQEHIIFHWLSLKSTIEYLGEWEMLYNPDFNCTEVGAIKNAVQWVVLARVSALNFLLGEIIPIYTSALILCCLLI